MILWYNPPMRPFSENLSSSICSLFGSIYAINACGSLGKIKIQKNGHCFSYLAKISLFFPFYAAEKNFNSNKTTAICGATVKCPRKKM